MPFLPRDPEHDIDAELRRLLAIETGRYLIDAAPAWTCDDPEA